MKHLFLGLLFVVTVVPARAVTLLVPSQHTTIQSAINAASDNDTVLVSPGTYVENLNFYGKPIHLTSISGRASTFIEAATQSTPIVLFTSGEGNQSILSGFTVRNVTSASCITCTGSSPSIINCEVSGSGLSGLVLSSSSAIIRGNNFVNNGQYPILSDAVSNPLNSENTFADNGTDAIAIQGGVLASDRTFRPDGTPYRVLSDLELGSYGIGIPVTTFLPGVTIKCDSGVGIRAVGDLYTIGFRAVGTVDSQIVFTSWNGLPGGWDGLEFVGDDWTANSAMEHCTVENAGQNGWGRQANIYFSPGWSTDAGADLPSLTRCIVRNSSQDGIYFRKGTVSITECVVEGNARHGINLEAASPLITGDTIRNNGQYPLVIDTGSNPQNNGNHYEANGIQAIANTGGGDITINRTFYFDQLPYRVMGDLVLGSWGIGVPSITIQPGVVLKFDNSAMRAVADAYPIGLFAAGTVDSPIVFTSWTGLSSGWGGIELNGNAWAPDHCWNTA